jgi:hypothetical protein
MLKFSKIYEKIPKILQLYWGMNEKMSFLHYLTVKSFIDNNPCWVVNIYVPTKICYKITWKTTHHKTKYNGKDFTEDVFNLNVNKKYIDFEEIGFFNDVSEVFKSDFFRYYILNKEGGVWADFDILFLKPLDDDTILSNSQTYYGCQDSINLVISYFNNYYSIGFIATTPNHPFCKTLLQNIKKHFNPNEYQSIGNLLIKKIFKTPNLITKAFPPVNILIIPEHYYLPYKYNEIEKIFNTSVLKNIKNDTIGIHWFNGSDITRKFIIQNNYNIKNSIFDFIQKYKN